MIEHKIDFKSLPWQSPMEGVRQKSHTIGSKQLRLVEYSKDLVPHWCEKGHAGYVLDGQMEIQFNGVTQTYSQGDGIFIPSGSEHAHRANILTDTVMVIFVEDV